MGEIAGVEVSVSEETSLAAMVDIGLAKFAGQLEEVSVAAIKEYSLERNLEKMQEEWEYIVFELIAYR